jgi:hypothetical protein
MGENPRKGKTHNLLHVRAELLDVALAALGAVAHIERDVDPIDALREHASDVLARLRAAVPAPTPPTTVPRCDTCNDTGRVLWQIEMGGGWGDVEDDGTVPCADCTPPTTVQADGTEDNWLQAEMKRAKARMDKVPTHARPTGITPPVTVQADRDAELANPTTNKENDMTTAATTLIRLTDAERESIRQRVIMNWIWETDATTADDQQDMADSMATEFELLLTARAAACVGCGEVRDDGPTDSDGNVWCGECAAEARQQGDLS